MEETSEALQKISSFARVLAVYFFLLFLLILNTASVSVFDRGNITPYFLLMGIYFWTLARPSLMPFYLSFLLGLTLDIISGGVIGLNGLCFLLISFILGGQRKFLGGQSWPVLWVGFGVASVIVASMHMLVFILMNGAWPGFSPLLATVMISFLAYPLTAAPMAGLNKFFRQG